MKNITSWLYILEVESVQTSEDIYLQSVDEFSVFIYIFKAINKQKQENQYIFMKA